MSKIKLKPPANTKAELMEQCVNALRSKYGVNVEGAVLYLLNYFTAVDLVGILADLERNHGKT